MNEVEIKKLLDKMVIQILELLDINNKILSNNLALIKENMELHKRCREIN
jgi:hypothetical protein